MFTAFAVCLKKTETETDAPAELTFFFLMGIHVQKKQKEETSSGIAIPIFPSRNGTQLKFRYFYTNGKSICYC